MRDQQATRAGDAVGDPAASQRTSYGNTSVLAGGEV